MKKLKKNEALIGLGILAIALIAAQQGLFGPLAIGLPGQTGGGAGLRWTIQNAIVDQARPFEILTGFSVPGCCGSEPYDTYHFVRLSIDGEMIKNDCKAQNYGGSLNIPYQGNECTVPHNAFRADFYGKSLLRVETAECHPRNDCTGLRTCTEEVLAGNAAACDAWGGPLAWSYAGHIETWVDSDQCLLEPGTVVVAETFSAGNTIALNDLRFPVHAFCSQMPILVTEAGTVVEQRLEEYQILADSFVTIPSGQTWTFFYITGISPDMLIVCPDGSVYNSQTNACEVFPAIVHVCSVGTFDPLQGLCIVQPESRIVCELGYYDTGQDKCVYHVPENQTEIICPEGSEVVTDDQGVKWCVFTPQTQIWCQKGIYDPVSDKCRYLPETEAVTGITLAVVGTVVGIAAVLAFLYLRGRKRRGRR